MGSTAVPSSVSTAGAPLGLPRLAVRGSPPHRAATRVPHEALVQREPGRRTAAAQSAGYRASSLVVAAASGHSEACCGQPADEAAPTAGPLHPGQAVATLTVLCWHAMALLAARPAAAAEKAGGAMMKQLPRPNAALAAVMNALLQSQLRAPGLTAVMNMTLFWVAWVLTNWLIALSHRQSAKFRSRPPTRQKASQLAQQVAATCREVHHLHGRLIRQACYLFRIEMFFFASSALLIFVLGEAGSKQLLEKFRKRTTEIIVILFSALFAPETINFLDGRRQVKSDARSRRRRR